MKARLLLFGMFLATGLVTSCSDDDGEPQPPHIVGSWDLKNYAVINFPDAYSSNEGLTLQLNEVNPVFTSYELQLMADATFNREKVQAGRLPLQDKGAWTLSDDVFTLEGDNAAQKETFNLERNQDDNLWLSIESQTELVEDAVLDTLTEAYVNSLSDDEIAALYNIVSFDLVFVFEREE